MTFLFAWAPTSTPRSNGAGEGCDGCLESVVLIISYLESLALVAPLVFCFSTADCHDRAPCMRDYFVLRRLFQVSRGAQVTTGVAHTQNDQIRSVLFSRLKNL